MTINVACQSPPGSVVGHGRRHARLARHEARAATLRRANYHGFKAMRVAFVRIDRRSQTLSQARAGREERLDAVIARVNDEDRFVLSMAIACRPIELTGVAARAYQRRATN